MAHLFHKILRRFARISEKTPPLYLLYGHSFVIGLLFLLQNQNAYCKIVKYQGIFPRLKAYPLMDAL